MNKMRIYEINLIKKDLLVTNLTLKYNRTRREKVNDRVNQVGHLKLKLNTSVEINLN